ncbi:NlpC/P60 family protein [Scandinavium sp. NPDC088450]|uniref:NlpC/P60 family protein n=1 Tax=Scandinavium sp. NPDC088450 TaxID=3364514 RepID=UPI00384EB5D7
MFFRLLVLIGLLWGFHCAAQADSLLVPHHTQEFALKPTKKAGNLKRRKRLMNEYKNWKGTRYRLGGNSHNAIDCSALTKRLYREAFAIDLPRTTTAQLKKGKKAKQLSPHIGDLVFFKTGRAQKHVGIYIGDNRFIHASRRKGVTISALSNPYWSNHLLAVRRVLPDTVVR